MKKIVIAGGTGFIGSYIAKRFDENGYKVIIVSRGSKNVRWIHDDLVKTLDGAELVINLAGKSINCRHNKKNRAAILTSRLSTTTAIGEAVKACSNPPKLWVNASAAGIYKPTMKRPMTEDEVNLGCGFLADVVTEWEKSFFDFALTYTRQVALRTTVVLDKSGGALAPLVKLTRFGLGGRHGSGRQFFSWIHVADYYRILLFLLKDSTLTGVVNCTSPKPVSNNEFLYTLRKKLHVLIGIPAPKLLIQVGSLLLGTESKLILNSSYVYPKRLLDAGFQFNYPTLDIALLDLLRSYKAR